MRSLIVAVGLYSGSPGDGADVDGFEQALNTSTKAQDKNSERYIRIKTSVLIRQRTPIKPANIQRSLRFENMELAGEGWIQDPARWKKDLRQLFPDHRRRIDRRRRRRRGLAGDARVSLSKPFQGLGV